MQLATRALCVATVRTDTERRQQAPCHTADVLRILSASVAGCVACGNGEKAESIQVESVVLLLLLVLAVLLGAYRMYANRVAQLSGAT